jgi:aminocarboxymuconate-semialdehyde decarboxylase
MRGSDARRCPGSQMSDNVPHAVDCHHHFVPNELFADLERYTESGIIVSRDRDDIVFGYGDRTTRMSTAFCDLPGQIRDLDAAGVKTAILSASILQSWLNLDGARLYNLEVAAAQQRYPGRFFGLAHVPPFGAPGNLRELERAVKEYGLAGVCITSSFRGRYPDDELYEPFYETVNRLNVPIFVHAALCPVDAPQLDPYRLGETLGRALDHTLVTARILYGGVLERHPNLRFLMGHLGGMFYGMTERLMVHAPTRPGGTIPKRDYAVQMRRIWYDTAPSIWNGSSEIEHATKTLGMHQLCFGSDYGIGKPRDAMLNALAALRRVPLSEEDLRRIESGNAAQLFNFED